MNTCQCPAKGHCPRRGAHVGQHQWEQCQAGRVEYVDQVIAALAKRRDYNQGASRPSKAKPVPRDQWPRWANALARFGKPHDIGVGDTIARIAARFGGELFKAWSKSLGVPCGCTERQHTYNALYPYERQI